MSKLITTALAVLGMIGAMPSAGIAHADDTQDAKFIAELADHGLRPLSGVAPSTYEAAQIRAAHEVCEELGQGMTRDEIIQSAGTPGPSAKQTMTIIINAAVDVYCPQYKTGAKTP